MINPSTEHLITLKQAARQLPGNVHLSTLHRWRLRGVKGVKLDTLMLGGRRYTSVEALYRFFERTTRAADGGSAVQRSADVRRRVERQLDEAGL